MRICAGMQQDIHSAMTRCVGMVKSKSQRGRKASVVLNLANGTVRAQEGWDVEYPDQIIWKCSNGEARAIAILGWEHLEVELDGVLGDLRDQGHEIETF